MSCKCVGCCDGADICLWWLCACVREQLFWGLFAFLRAVASYARICTSVFTCTCFHTTSALYIISPSAGSVVGGWDALLEARRFRYSVKPTQFSCWIAMSLDFVNHSKLLAFLPIVPLRCASIATLSLRSLAVSKYAHTRLVLGTKFIPAHVACLIFREKTQKDYWKGKLVFGRMFFMLGIEHVVVWHRTWCSTLPNTFAERWRTTACFLSTWTRNASLFLRIRCRIPVVFKVYTVMFFTRFQIRFKDQVCWC